ncbi:MAG: DNA phosphorothioation-associated putative methyltransferase [Nitrospira sp. CR1.3]|nr:DNA phosphorothioation-associated putative methyltransferase [Nitrospira sp. CR1.3]
MSSGSAPHNQLESTLLIRRGQTAIRRVSCSRPIALALADGIITKTSDVFDYGCGHGSDIRFLRANHIHADGWDPHYRPEEKATPAQVVNLSYVLNVIESLAERDETLLQAFALAKQVLIIAVRVESPVLDGDEYADGILTSRGTFQKIYGQAEFREYVETKLQKRTHVAALGVVYVFKDEEAEARYVASRAFTRRLEYRTDLIADFKKNNVAKHFVNLANRLGRLPLAEEFPKYPKLLESFGSPKRIERLTLGLINHSAFQGSRDQRREDILTYLAMLRLENIKPPPIAKLPVSIQSDIKAIWKTYGEALKEGEEFLFTIGKPEVVANMCATCPVGKHLPSHLYVHRSAEDELPPLLRVLLFGAKRIVGEVPYDLVKFAKDGRAVSLLLYKDFDGDPHPALLRSVKVFLPKATFDVREYFASDNPPILHRKETFVLPNYPHFQTFKRLSEQEETLGLLSAPDIGYRRLWDNLLLARGLRIENHNLLNVAPT